MKKGLYLLPILLVMIALLVSCSGSAGSSGSSGVLTPSASAASTTATQASPATNKAAISIENFAFNPAVLTVKAGTTVVWTNNDSPNHDIKSDSFNSPKLAKGETFEFKFDTAGTYDYICGIHPSMKGQIIVQ